jgi:hypothetical protein
MIRNCNQAVRKLFSTSKYFLDLKYQSKPAFMNLDLKLIADDNLGSLHTLSGIFTDNKIDMRYIKTHL